LFTMLNVRSTRTCAAEGVEVQFAHSAPESINHFGATKSHSYSGFWASDLLPATERTLYLSRNRFSYFILTFP
jgi:hypothetical protein